AGAGSIAEIIRTQAPSILVPYPFARDDHQTANARFVQNKDAALVVEETQFASLLDEVVKLLFDNSRLEILCQNLKALDRPEEVNLLADALEELMANRQAKHTHSPVPPKEA
ncbi:MAG: glycosyltransferase, partial [Verrucomicrobia bacterium]|nr:glycosyltransferase [Verrucomicrobiota bacterium]